MTFLHVRKLLLLSKIDVYHNVFHPCFWGLDLILMDLSLVVFCRKGHVCMIPETKEFFIAAKDHDEWGSAHTVWGMVGESTACINA